MKSFLRKVVMGLIHRFGTRLIDQRTGRSVGRVLVWAWGGRIHVIGLPNLGEEPEQQVRWKTEPRAVFYRQSLEFFSHPEPDFPHEQRVEPDTVPSDGQGN